MKKQLLTLMLICASMSSAQPALTIVDTNGTASFSVEDELTASGVAPEGRRRNGPKPIAPMFVDKQLRNVATEKLVRMLAKGDGYLRVRRMEDGEYGLQCHIRGNGGGPTLGYALYIGTKVVLYGALLGGVGVTVATGVGAAAGGMASALGASAATATTVTGVVTAGTATATKVGITALSGGASVATSIATSAAAGGFVAAGGTGIATEVAVATAATTGSVGGLIGAIEGAALFMGALGGLAPTI